MQTLIQADLLGLNNAGIWMCLRDIYHLLDRFKEFYLTNLSSHLMQRWNAVVCIKFEF